MVGGGGVLGGVAGGGGAGNGGGTPGGGERAVGRAGTLSGAARHLGINHSTVFRKVNAIEERVGVRFFDRLPTGYRMTQAREVALSCAERIERTNAPCSTRADGAPLPSVEVA